MHGVMQRHHRHRRDTGFVEQLFPLHRGPGGKLLLDGVVERLHVPGDRGVIGESRVLRDVSTIDDLPQLCAAQWRSRRNRQMPLLAAVGVADITALARGIAHQRRRFVGGDRAQHFASHHGDGGFQHGHVDALPHARARALKQRADDGQRRRIARAVIHDGGAGLERPALRRAGNAHHAAHRLYHAIDGRVAFLGARLTVTGDGAEDDARIDFL